LSRPAWKDEAVPILYVTPRARAAATCPLSPRLRRLGLDLLVI